MLGRMALLAATNSVAPDPFFSSVSLLIPGTGANNSTTFVDYSPTPKALTAVSGAKIITSVNDPFGNSTGVMSFNGANSYIQVGASNSSQFPSGGTEPYTIESWIYYLSSPESVRGAIFSYGSFGINNSVLAFRTGDGTRALLNYWWANDLQSSGAVFSANTWTHVAATWSGSVRRIFANGTLVASDSPGAVLNIGHYGNIKVGSSNNGEFFSGYFSNLRVTKNICRYTASFSVPTGPFPLS